MKKVRVNVGAAAAGLLVCAALAAPAPSVAQAPPASGVVDGRWPLQPSAGVGRVVAPFLEGWYRNPDGTISYSFGYLNLNDSTVEIPLGEQNQITPEQFDGMQPTVFLPGRHRGMFSVTVPPDREDEEIWWTITNPDGEVTKVPGRTVWSAYMLDWNPRPHGTETPVVTFPDGQEPLGFEGRGPLGVMAERTITTNVGTPTELAITVEEVSERDPADPRFREPTSLRVVWTAYQGPTGSKVEFTRHASTPAPEEAEGGRGGGRGAPPPSPNEIMVPSGEGTARVLATFSLPGEYLLHAQVDNWRVPDSSSGDQCCWTNGYQRVVVR